MIKKKDLGAVENRLVVFVLFQAVVYYLNYILTLLDLPGYASQIGYPWITLYSLYILFITAIFDYRRVALVVLVTGILFTLSIVAFENTYILPLSLRSFVLSETNICFSIVLPMIWIHIQGVDFGKFINNTRNVCNVIILMQLAIFIGTIVLNKHPISKDYMSYAYSALFPFFICFYFRKRSLFQATLAFAAFLLQLISGCRGAMLASIVYCLISVLREKKNSLVHQLLIIITSSLVFANLDYVILFSSKTLERIGFKSRTLTKLAQGTEWFWASERVGLYNTAKDSLNLFGYGVFGDRRVLGTYVHNWILELLLHYGVIIGIVLVLIIIWQFVEILILSCEDINDHIINFEVAASVALIGIKFMLSSSYLISPEFALSIMFLVDANRRAGKLVEKIASNNTKCKFIR